MMKPWAKWIVIVSTALVIVCIFWGLRKRSGKNNTITADQLTGTTRLLLGKGMLDGSVVDEGYIDTRILPGMSVREVESVLGEPYLTTPFMGTERASYKISLSSPSPMSLTGLEVVYDDGKVKHVDKSFGQ